jgi:hypothetical protein
MRTHRFRFDDPNVTYTKAKLQAKLKEEGRCWSCQKTGHECYECPENPKARNGQRPGNNGGGRGGGRGGGHGGDRGEPKN